MDIVVLCNVLHEIPPKDWISLFRANSIIDHVLADNGYVLIVEDSIIPVGEMPHTDGFFILGKAELKTLFSITNSEAIISESHKNSGRLCAYLIPKEYLKNISDTTRKNALQLLRDNVIDKIQNIRKPEPNAPVPSYKNGRKYAFLTQQLANVILFLKDH